MAINFESTQLNKESQSILNRRKLKPKRMINKKNYLKDAIEWAKNFLGGRK